jgi:hypothetical protein
MNTRRPPEAASLPTELLGAIPRDVELTAGGRITLGIAAAFVVAAVASAVVMSWVYMDGEQRRALHERDGVFINAEVTRVTYSKSDDGRRRTVTFTYEVDGRSYVGRQRLRNSDQRIVADGGTIAIGFVSSDPQTSWVRGYEEGGFPLAVIPFVSLALLATGFVVAWSVHRQRAMLSEGRVTLARVVNYKKKGDSHTRRYRVACEFQTLSGAQQTAYYDTGKAPPAVGAIVPILYHRDTPTRTSAYPVPLVRTVRRA